MNENRWGNTAPKFMTAAIQGICENLPTSGKMTWPETFRTLERLHHACSRRLVSYTYHFLERGSSYLQIHPRMLPGREVLEATFHARERLEEAGTFEEALFAVASLTVLLSASEEVLSGLSPNADIHEFWQAHEDGMCLVCDVMDKLRTVVIIE